MARITKFNRNLRVPSTGFAFGAEFAMEIVIQGSDFVDTFDNYPLVLNTDSGDNFKVANALLDLTTGALSGGGDLRAVLDPFDEGTRLALEIVRCIPSATPQFGQLEIWINAKQIAASTDRTIYILWGIPGGIQPGEGDPFGTHAVWNTSGSGPQWVMVSHMQDHGGQDHVRNSVGTVSVFNKFANNRPQEDSTGVYEGDIAQNFNTVTTDYIVVPDSVDLTQGTSMGIMMWVKYPTGLGAPNGFQRMASRKVNFADNNGWEINLVDNDDNHFEVLGSNSNAYRPQLPFNWSSPIEGPRGNGWHCLQVDFKSGNAVDCVADGVDLPDGAINSIVDNSNAMVLGQNVGFNETPFRGLMSEFRMCTADLSNELWKSMYKGMADPENHIVATQI